MTEYKVPEGLLFYKEHEWVTVPPKAGGTVTVGVSDYAQAALTDIVYANIKIKPGDRIKLGQVIGELESVKSVSDLYSPVTGEVIEVNKALSDRPESINKDPYGSAWFFKAKPTNFDGDKANLMNSAKYKEYCSKL